MPHGAAYDIGAMEYWLVFPDSAAARLIAWSPQVQGWHMEFTGPVERSYRVETPTEHVTLEPIRLCNGKLSRLV